MELLRCCLGIRTGLLGFTLWPPSQVSQLLLGPGVIQSHRRSSVLIDGRSQTCQTQAQRCRAADATVFLLFHLLYGGKLFAASFSGPVKYSNLRCAISHSHIEHLLNSRPAFVTNLHIEMCNRKRTNSFIKKIFREKNDSLESSSLSCVCVCVYNSYPGQYLDYYPASYTI